MSSKIWDACQGTKSLTSRSPIPGAADQIATLWQRHRRLETSLQHYETQIAEQAAQLSKLNKSRDYGSDYQSDGDVDAPEPPAFEEFTQADMRQEEEEIQELERKKRSLEERVSNMEKDISGVTR
jgi:vacuolar-type H+-ATPase subunit I/STV1